MDFKDLVSRFTSRTTLFCSAFFVVGNIIHYFHHLDATYITFMGTLLGFVTGHAVQENYFQGKTPSAGGKQ